MKNTEQKSFWEQQDLDIQSMMLNKDVDPSFEERERTEILSYLPDLNGLRILEPAAGIGRFTTCFAPVAAQVTAQDFVHEFIDSNKSACCEYPHVCHAVGDIMEADFPAASFDHIFINWLLMYIRDEDLPVLARRLTTWLSSQGTMFVRESCVSASNPNQPHPHTHYRDPEVYERLFADWFQITAKGNVKVYEQEYNNPNQRWWLLTKKG
ncbi:methyltransferase domain-containing protein [Desulfovermiculus halophilus]|jgi:ubiquinone/menaquinone biosynthesis C-methylase UbiE|uniref:methyltransferase domain-containing protein n=1 Tax=Desulfovermiculus halophilus TaxID=339722 RepID=UPI0004828F56|nr:methyltransferase domain-containing protein [Desulfovermiculus halophilus]